MTDLVDRQEEGDERPAPQVRPWDADPGNPWDIGRILEFRFFRGRVALRAILQGLGVRSGDEVALQAFTCVALPEALAALGAKPLWIDVTAGGLGMDPTHLEASVTTSTKAIIVQHTFGVPVDLAPILEIARRRGIPVVEDCCHTFSSTYRGRAVGTFGSAAFYSFEWGKPVRGGLGGSARVNDPALRPALAAICENLRPVSLGQRSQLAAQSFAFQLLYRPSVYWPVRRAYRVVTATGIARRSFNPVELGESASDEFSMRMAPETEHSTRKKLVELPARTALSLTLAKEYDQSLPGALRRVAVPQGASPVLIRFPFLTDRKEHLLARAQVANVEVSGWYETPIHPLAPDASGGARYRAGQCPEAEALCRQIVTLPCHPHVTRREAEKIIKFLGDWAR